MKIYEIIPALESGGAERFTVDLSNDLAELGHNVIIITLFDADKNSILEPYVKKNIVKRISLHKKPGLDITCFLKLLRLIIKGRPDVVHVHVGAIKYVILAATLYRNCKYFATIHSEAKREAGKGVELYSRKYLFKSKRIIPVTISDESRNSFIDFYGFNVPMITNGCSSFIGDKKLYNSYHKDVDTLFIHAGRLHSVKNQVVLVQAFDKLIKKGYNIRLILMGRIDESFIYEQIKPYLTDKIMFIGEQCNCREYMASADAFCLSSIMEGMPISIIEAFSVGCVPISTPVGGCVNMIEDGINGILSSGTDVDCYSNAVERFLNLSSKEIMSLKSYAFKTFTKSYSIRATSEKYVSLFSK